MIQRFLIENFKSFRSAELPLGPLTLLIGANASGKSNAVEAIRLLSWVAAGHRLEDLLFAIREREISLRGTLNDLSWHGNPISLGCQVLDPASQNELTYSVTLRNGENGLSIVDEQPRDLASGEQLTPGYLLRRALDILVLEPDPRRMREYSFKSETRLKEDGSALSSVLRYLTDVSSAEVEILGFISSLPEQDIRGISFLETPRQEVMVRLHETFGGQEIPRDAAVLSDGTLRVLAVAAALLSVDNGSLVVIEEIDNGVHPSRAEALLSSIQKIARQRELRVLLTAHNPALLDALPPEAIPDTVACYRDPDDGDSRLIRLEELESYPELVAQGPLGRLMTEGILDRFLKTRELRDRGKRIEKGLAWISEFRKQAGAS